MAFLSRSRLGIRTSGIDIVVAGLLCLSMIGGQQVHADILRGGAGPGSAPTGRPSEGRQTNPGAETAAASRQRAQDRLARTTQAITAMRAVQSSAQARSVIALRSPGPVPDGLRPGGLQLATGANARLSGANEPVANGRTITIQQTESQAVLHWETFNIGRRTNVYFDQKAGGVDSGKWIAFNKIFDPSGKPSQILGSIRADGQVYILNQNGIVFGSGSQVNARGLVASALPINDALIERGLLNQEAGNPQFLLSALPQGSFVPPTALTPSGKPGNVMVDVGARLFAPVSAEGSGGRIILAGANVDNRGTISTPSGQTILAAGRQVGFDAHPSNDPSLRGLDVYIGEVGTGAGTVRNSGIIDIPTGSLTMAGKAVEQLGAIESTTTVSLNGRVDLLASYGAVPNSEFDPSISGGAAPFLNRETGTLTLGEGSVTRILPDILSDATTVGTSFPIRSRINLEGLSIHLAKGAMVQAPNADITARAGLWTPPQTITGADGSITFRRVPPDFVFTNGQIYVDSAAFVDVSGTMDVFVPQSQSVFTVQLRGNELAVSPVQRDGILRGTDLVIDTRNTGTYNGRFWVGTPLGDASGFLNIIERNAAQLSAGGGTITLQAGQAIVARENTQFDVSGGYFRHEGGVIDTSVLRIGGNLVDIKDATPDRAYDGIYTATSTVVRAKWGISETFRLPLAPSNRRTESDYLSGASGGSLTITAPAIALDGELFGHTVIGRDQVRSSAGNTSLPQASSLSLNFFGQLDNPAPGVVYPTVSATAPTIQFGGQATQQTIREFSEDSILAQPNESARLIAIRNLGLAQTSPTRVIPSRVDSMGEEVQPPLPVLQPERSAKLVFSEDFFQDSGFGIVQIDNSEGDFVVPLGVDIQLPLQGELSVTARNITIDGGIRAPGGSLSFTAHNLSEYQAQILQTNATALTPKINPSIGTIRLGRNAALDVSGLILDDRIGDFQPLVLDAGSVSLTGYNIDLAPGSIIDASGGARISRQQELSYGYGGRIQISAGEDPFLKSVVNGSLILGGTLQAYSGASGGTLAIRAPMIQIGGEQLDGRALLLDPDFFNRGGFQNFELSGIGLVPKMLPELEPGEVASFLPSVYVAPGAVVEPRSVGLIGSVGPDGNFRLDRQVLPDGERNPVSISLAAPGVRRDFVDPSIFAVVGDILIRGDIVIGDGARIQTEPGGEIRVQGETVSVFGALRAPGGRVEVVGASAFPLSVADRLVATYARPTVHLGPNARLTAEGALVRQFDRFGRRIGQLFDGGVIRVAGNIFAEAGSMLNVSGASAEFDLSPAQVGVGLSENLRRVSGITRSPAALRSFTTVLHSNGGTIQLQGSEMLFSDATLSGRAGGPTALGGTLEVSSGRFYRPEEGRTGADINLIVSQHGRVIARTNNRMISRDENGDRIVTQRSPGVGVAVVDNENEIISGIGFFSVDQFASGGFDSLDLGFNYNENAVPIPIGGNVEFRGPVSISARGFLRVAGGGIIKADNRVSLNADYLAIGQPFRDPQNPADTFFSFQQNPIPGGQTTPVFNPVATFGTGVLNVNAKHIDVGTVVMQDIGRATLSAKNGDIRGNGSLNIAGKLALDAAQIYPTTLAQFDIIAFDHAKGKGSISITRTGTASLPLSAGGTLNIYATNISQGGNLVAPFGTIRLGWDGSDFDPSDTDFDRPESLAVGRALQIPVANKVELQRGSTTSVSGIDSLTGRGIQVPFGVSPDGLSWIDPRGVNVTASGLPVKQVIVAGNSVNAAPGSTIDIRGGGELSAFRWIAGNGGPVDVLGSPSASWSSSISYDPGALVSYNGQTWSARVAITGTASNTAPEVNRLWSLVPEAFAVLPGFGGNIAPFARYNQGPNAGDLGGDPGFTSSRLRAGDQISIAGSSTLSTGTYTLLPARYALLPGATLVTPQTTPLTGLFANADGSEVVSGYRFNAFNRANSTAVTRQTFEVASAPVVARRAEYEVLRADSFAQAAVNRLNLETLQRLPRDAGHVSIQGNQEIILEGTIRSWRPAAGRGASIDISSLSDIVISESAEASDGVIVLRPSRLVGFGAESLLIGGQRRFTEDGIFVTVTTPNLTLDNRGSSLRGPDVMLASRGTLTFAPGASLKTSGQLSQAADTFIINSPGALVRVSSDPGALTLRSEAFTATEPLLQVGESVSIRGGSVTMDSSSRFSLDSSSTISGKAITLRSAGIQVVFDPNIVPSNSTVVDPLTLSGNTLASIQQAQFLTLGAYQGAIDLFGAGSLGTTRTERLTLQSSAIRGFGLDGGTVQLSARTISIANYFNAPVPGASADTTGTLGLTARQVRIGRNESRIDNFSSVLITAKDGLLLEDTGQILVENDLDIVTPVIVTSSGATQEIRAGGRFTVTASGDQPRLSGGIGGSVALLGQALTVGSSILAPSGVVSLTATSGNLVLSGLIDVSGIRQSFYDAVRFTDAGTIRLSSAEGNVEIGAEARINVAGLAGGGSAGSLFVSAPKGRLIADGTLIGNAADGERSGLFSIDAFSLDSFSLLAEVLNDGGFAQSRDFRVRDGDVVIDGNSRSHSFSLSADAGSITVRGTIDSSGETGGSIALTASNDLKLDSTAVLTVAAQRFSSAGKGGEIRLEAGSQIDGVVNAAAALDLGAGSVIDLSVADYIEGDFLTNGSSAFQGQFTGTLHLRAPRNAANDDFGLQTIGSTIINPSSIVAEGYALYELTGSGVITGWRSSFTALPQTGTLQRTIYNQASSYLSTANHDAMLLRLLGSDNQGLSDRLVLAPGVEIINRTGDLRLGSTNSTAIGSAGLNSADWNLSDFRFGPKLAPGVLTLKAAGNIELLNALSDGFRADTGSVSNPVTLPSGTLAGQSLWLSPLTRLNTDLPVNAQSWSFRLTAGADLASADFRRTVELSTIGADSGSLLLGKSYPALIPGVSGVNASTATALNNRYQVIRTGTGSIQIHAARDVQLRNQFATIYTAGVRIPDPVNVFGQNDFAVPVVARFINPSQPDLGRVQQTYQPQWSISGGNVMVSAGRDIGRYIQDGTGAWVIDSSRQIPTNWLYRRSYVDPSTGLFGVAGVDSGPATITDPSGSTAWWVDFSNFFEGFGALGGGNLSLVAGNDIVNADAAIPTTARMSGLSVDGTPIAPDLDKLLELGGGDLLIQAGRNIDGGIFYVERGHGRLIAGGSIKTNASRSPSLGILGSSSLPDTADGIIQSRTPEVFDPLTWLPTTLFLGKGGFDVTARRDVLLGPTLNTFLVPQGLNNRFWYKTYFTTYAEDSKVEVRSFGGSITHRLAVTLPLEVSPRPIFQTWLQQQNLFRVAEGSGLASNFQPWIRLAETQVTPFETILTLAPPILRSTSFSGDINIVGTLNLFPSSQGTIEITAFKGINGLQPSGRTIISGGNEGLTAYTAARINVSDADPRLLPGILNPISYQGIPGVGRNALRLRQTAPDFLAGFDQFFAETGSFTGTAAGLDSKRSLHSETQNHLNSSEPIRVYAGSGDVSGFTLFAPKFAQILAARDITDIAFYLQNANEDSVSIVSAGRDIIPFNQSSPTRALAADLDRGNVIVDRPNATILRDAQGNPTTSNVLAGDIQINGPGTLEVLAGRTIDLGTGPNYLDGTGVGITSIGRLRNPFLPSGGANVLIVNGISGIDGGAALGLRDSAFDFSGLLEAGLLDGNDSSSELDHFSAIGRLFAILRDSATDATSPFTAGYAAIDTLLAGATPEGDILTRSRDVRTAAGGSISVLALGGELSMAPSILGNPLVPPGIVTEAGGEISILVDKSLNIGQARVFTLRGGDLTIWSSQGDIAAGSAPKTVVTAPPTRVSLDAISAALETDLGGLATGGGIGVLASVRGVEPGNVSLIAPRGTVDAGDAGIRATGDITIAAVTVLNADNISAAGTSTGVPSAPVTAVPNVSGLSAGASSSAAALSSATEFADQTQPQSALTEELPSVFTVEVLGYGGGETDSL